MFESRGAVRQSYQLKGCVRRLLTGLVCSPNIGILGKRRSEPENMNDQNLILRISQCLHFIAGKFSFLAVDRSQEYLSRPHVIQCWIGGLNPLDASFRGQ